MENRYNDKGLNWSRFQTEEGGHMNSDFVIGKGNKDLKIFIGEDEWSGVKRVSGYVSNDIELVTGVAPEVIRTDATELKVEPGHIYAGTLGHSSLTEALTAEGIIDPAEISGKREVYRFDISEAGGGPALFITGSDKRGTIYGLFHISELLGVSPWVWFADVIPAKKDRITIGPDMSCTSGEPSVEYRGIFINDEWPSFGNWTTGHFGGFNAEMYEHVFELILRLKGNYLWPAMWSANFSLDGPGLDNAILADEMGICMSNSHHDPCLRHSEEWDLVKGEDSPYGTEWNFDKNREGLTNYWRDGLKRNGGFENIITMGMRGERDSEVLGRSATLRENIDYIKEVVTVQNDLIKETVNEDLTSVPRMIAIYKEVEQYYLGDESTTGLKEWDGLDGITCMLCDDNHGNMRGLPLESERDRQGGYGMYYHFDYHGGPVSYEWINSSTISKTREQMSEAYEAGVRKIWIVNTGDLKPQELPISFFMDLAYDYDRWGESNADAAEEYLDKWVREQFGDMDIPTGYEEVSAADDIPASMIEQGQTVRDAIKELIEGYTYINSIRRPEALNADVYHPFNYGESDRMLHLAAKLYNKAAYLSTCIFEETPLYDAYEELVGFPVRAACNLLYMQLCAGKNKYLARGGSPSANVYTTYIDECMFRDGILTDLYHSLADGKWDGMMMSEHIGFTNWNDEEAAYPVLHSIFPSRKQKLLVYPERGEQRTAGGDWTGKPIILTDFLDPSENVVFVVVENAGTGKVKWKASADRSYLKVTPGAGTLREYEPREEDPQMGILRPFPSELIKNTELLAIEIDREALELEEGKWDIATVNVDTDFAHVKLIIPVTDIRNRDPKRFVPMIPAGLMAGLKESGGVPEAYVCNELGLILSADDYDHMEETAAGRYVTLSPYGKYKTAVKAYPATEHFETENAPSLTYDIVVPEECDLDITIITAPSNPIDGSRHLRIGVAMNDGAYIPVSMVDDDYRGGENDCPQWCRAVLDQEHSRTITMHAGSGVNSLRLCAMDPGVVTERILIRAHGTRWAPGYIRKD